MKKYVYSSAVGLVLGALAFQPCADATQLGDFEREWARDGLGERQVGGGLLKRIRQHCLTQAREHGIVHGGDNYAWIFPEPSQRTAAHTLGIAYAKTADASIDEFPQYFRALREAQAQAIREGTTRDTQSPPPPSFDRRGATGSDAGEEEGWRAEMRARFEAEAALAGEESDEDIDDEAAHHNISAQLRRYAVRPQQQVGGAAAALAVAAGGGADLEEDRGATLRRLEAARQREDLERLRRERAAAFAAARGAPVDEEEHSDSNSSREESNQGEIEAGEPAFGDQGDIFHFEEDVSMEAVLRRLREQNLEQRAAQEAERAAVAAAAGAEVRWPSVPPQAPRESFEEALRRTQREEAQRRQQEEVARNQAAIRARQAFEEEEAARSRLAAAADEGGAGGPLPPSYSQATASVPAGSADEAAIIEALKEMERDQLAEVGEHAYQPSQYFLDTVTPGLGKKPIAEAKRIVLQILREPAAAVLEVPAAPIERPVAVRPAGAVAAGGGPRAQGWEQRMEEEKATLDLLKEEQRERMRAMGGSYEPDQQFINTFMPELNGQYLTRSQLLERVRNFLAE